MKSILLLSFVSYDNLYDALEQISETLGIQKSQIFVFKIVQTNDYALTYNLSADKVNIQFNSIYPTNTIAIHRKKMTNTLYSLNAMNEIIKKENNGVFKKNYNLDWEKYENSLIIIKNGKVKVFETKLIRINQ